VQDGREQIVQMSNGCICCTIRGDLVQALSDLVTQRDEGKIAFDRVVIETTGVANPARWRRRSSWTRKSPRATCWTP
jgi:G3E family GTPase